MCNLSKTLHFRIVFDVSYLSFVKDIISLIAPRLFIALSGDKDHIFPYSGAKKVINGARNIYKKLNAAEKIICIKVKGKHQYYNKESWEVLDKHMKF